MHVHIERRNQRCTQIICTQRDRPSRTHRSLQKHIQTIQNSRHAAAHTITKRGVYTKVHIQSHLPRARCVHTPYLKNYTHVPYTQAHVAKTRVSLSLSQVIGADGRVLPKACARIHTYTPLK